MLCKVGSSDAGRRQENGLFAAEMKEHPLEMKRYIQLGKSAGMQSHWQTALPAQKSPSLGIFTSCFRGIDVL
eukprot:4958639-Pleurochrysis_carterae.AAC.1